MAGKSICNGKVECPKKEDEYDCSDSVRFECDGGWADWPGGRVKVIKIVYVKLNILVKSIILSTFKTHLS